MCNAQEAVKYRLARSMVYDGKWVIAQRSTDRPVIIDGTPLDCLTAHEAEDLVNLMNDRDVRAHKF
ncbi:hypothetical protein B5K06_32345 [Rhizobium grahamii]|uniref:Uncharacterized protein n=1 Tax=Rhizobium grahamii TaxID=1120045 RepID=A0A370KEX4_9HYPH|nr:hypothetical protein B5K06_32345 [Rhizobium grahamii]